MYRMIGWVVAALLVGVIGAAQGAPDFTLREELNRQWTHECVTFPVNTAAQFAAGQTPLLDDAGKEVVYQVIPGDKGTGRIAFQTDLAPLGTRTFTFAANGKANATTDLKVEETADGVTLTNSKTGIRLIKTMGENGPIAGIRMLSGVWAGGSRLVGNTPVSASELTVTARGPVFSEAVVKLTFANQYTWQARFRMYAGEPVVLVDETSAMDGSVSMQLMLSDNFAADSLFFQSADGPYGKNMVWKIEKGLVFDWEPWLRWHASVRRGSTFSVFNEQSNDLLTVAAGWAGAWVDPTVPFEKQAYPPLKVLKDDTGVHVDMPLKTGQRRWMFGAFDKTASLAIMQEKGREIASPIPYKYLIKYGQFPLDMVKDYVLRWPSDLTHPRLLITPPEVARFRAAVTDLKPYQQRAAYYAQNPSALSESNLDDAIPAYLATQNQQLGAQMANKAIEGLQFIVNYLVDQDGGLPFGAAPHNYGSLGASVNLADQVYSSPDTTPEQRERLHALAAFLGYTTARSDYWSTARGYAANPNMTTSVYGYQTALAAFLADHPSAKAWVQEGMTALKDQLDTWSDDNGGWLEAPHYAMVSYDQILGGLVIANNAGFNDWLYTDPKVKTVARWFAQIDSPPDSRLGGYRHRPAVGNTYINEPNGDFGIVAYLFREKDPKFSAEMQWQWLQNKMFNAPGIGGFFPAFAGYRVLLTDPKLPARAPHYTSALFPKTGVVLRDSYPSARETYLHMIQGDNHAHYDNDSGSIIIYGKGRILADDFGYWGYTPQDEHSMVEAPQAGSSNLHVITFVSGPRFDYVSGVKNGWTRQIVMVKGATPDAPCYFVLNDSLKVAGPATWRLWLTAQDLKVQGQTALSVGKEDVDMDIVFLTPTGVALTTESKTRQAGSGMYPDWHWEGMKTTQLGLIANPAQTDGFAVVLYPRLKTARPPVCTPLAGGKGVKIDTEAGIDFVFLSPTPFTYDAGTIHFSGTVGMVQIRGKDVQLALGSDGKLSARGKTIKKMPVTPPVPPKGMTR